MAAKPSTAAEKALQNIRYKVVCGICLEPYTQPKMLRCFHVFCEKCLQSLVRQNSACPHCGQVVAPADPIKKIAMRGQAVSLCVEALDREGEACLRPVDSLGCELVSSDGSSRVRGSVKRRDENRYDITYQPQLIGRHQLHVLIEERPILNSPFTVTILPNLTAPANIIGDLKEPFGIGREGRW